MATDSFAPQPAARPAATTAAPSAAGALLVLLACLPYAIMAGMLPESGDFPNEGGGEATIGWGFQQFWSYLGGAATLGLLWLALWRGARSGGIAGWARRAIPVLIPTAGAAMLFAIAESFEQPGPWLPLIPIVLPPVIAAYALWGCLLARSRRLPSGLPRETIDGVAIGLIALLSLAVIPFAMLDAASWPRRLAQHHADRAAADAASRAAGEQDEQALREKFARLGPNSSLRDYIEDRFWYLSGVDVLAAARQVNSRQADAIAMLDEGLILDLRDLRQLDLRPSPALCEAYGRALVVAFVRSDRGLGSAYLSLLNGQLPNMRWLREAGCDLDGSAGQIDARVAWMLESKDPSGAAANDTAADHSRFGVSRETVEAARAELAGLRGVR